MTASARDVARMAGLSRAQVSNYFNRPDLVSTDAKRRIQRAIDELGYVRNESARQLRAGVSRTIAMILLDAWFPYASDLSRGAEEEAERRGWTLQFSNSGRDEERERRHLDHYQSWRVQGVIITPEGDLSDRLERLLDRGIACVLLDPPHSHPVSDRIPSIAVDHVTGGSMAGTHLLERGGQRFAFVGDPTRSTHSADRLEGFRTALGAGADRLRLIETDDLSIGAGTKAAAELLGLPAAERPDAVFAANDLTALGLMHALSGAGVSVPTDVKVVGYDDIDFAAQIATPLTTIRQPATLLGSRAVGQLLAQIEGPIPPASQHIVLEPELVVRSST